MMKKFLLSLVKGLIPEIVDTVLAVTMSKLKEDIEKSKHLNDAEKSATGRGADLLAIRLKEELVKQLNS